MFEKDFPQPRIFICVCKRDNICYSDKPVFLSFHLELTLHTCIKIIYEQAPINTTIKPKIISLLVIMSKVLNPISCRGEGTTNH